MAIIGNSYLYHMRKDLVENIEPGVGQHMGENALALLLHLSGHASPLPQLTDGYSKPEMVYFSHVIPYFFIYTFSTAKIIYAVFLIVTVALIRFRNPFPAKTLVLSVLATILAFVGALAGANAVALVMTHVLDKSMSWFKDELSTIVLYGPAAILGTVLTFCGILHLLIDWYRHPHLTATVSSVTRGCCVFFRLVRPSDSCIRSATFGFGFRFSVLHHGPSLGCCLCS